MSRRGNNINTRKMFLRIYCNAYEGKNFLIFELDVKYQI